MSYSVKIYGAGSIGNHYANQYVGRGWRVSIYDKDQKALLRTKKLIYPSRYGKWNKKIKLLFKDDDKFYDLIVIGTPPSSHYSIAKKQVKKGLCKLLHIEKPLTVPNNKTVKDFKKLSLNNNIKFICGYNHIFTKCISEGKKILSKNVIGKITSISSYNMVHWGVIFKAHPWLKGPHDSYLGFYKKGGGSLCEHSHGLNLLIHFINHLNLGKINKINSSIYFNKSNKINYDYVNFINFKTDKNVVSNLIQDVVTSPSIKKMHFQGEKGSMEMILDFKKNLDAIIIKKNDKEKIIKFKKNRAKDFEGQVNFITKELKTKKDCCKKIFNESILTMQLICKAFQYNKS